MIKTKYGVLVESARLKQQSNFAKSIEWGTFDSFQKAPSNLTLWAQELDAVNKHIT